MIVEVKNPAGHFAAGERHGLKILHHTVVPKCLCHFYGAPFYHLSIWQSRLGFRKFERNGTGCLEAGFLCCCCFDEKLLLFLYFRFPMCDDSSSGCASILVVFSFVHADIVAAQIEVFHCGHVCKHTKHCALPRNSENMYSNSHLGRKTVFSCASFILVLIFAR